MKYAQCTLAIAVSLALVGQVAHADEPATDLGVLKVSKRQGTKVKTNVVTDETINKSTQTDLRGLLKEEPAIEFGGGNGTSQFYNIRGMGQNSIDVKIDDGHSDSQILYHQGRFMLDPSLVKIVSVQKGAGSASAGIGATNGAIIAETLDADDLLKNSTNPNFGAKVKLGYASNNSKSYGVSAFGKQGNFDALVSFNRLDEDNYKAGKGYKANVTGDSVVPYSALDKTGILAKVGYDFNDNHRLELSHMREQHKGVRTIREEFALLGANDQLKLWDNNNPVYRETTLSNTNLQWTASNLGFVDNLKANAYRMQNKRYSADDSGCGYCGNIAGPTTTTISTRGANLNLDTYLRPDLLVKYGLNYRNQTVSPDRFLKPNLNSPEKTDVGLYAEAIKTLGEFTVTGGLRYDSFDFKAMDGKSVSNNAVSPSVGVIYEPSAVQGLSISANHNHATRSPRLYDALLTHGNRGITSIKDGTKAERAKNTEIGFNYNMGDITLDGSYFWQTVDNAVVNPQDKHNVKGVKETANVGYIKNQGFELGASYRKDGFTGRIAVADSSPKLHSPDIVARQKAAQAKGEAFNRIVLTPEFAARTGTTWTASATYQFAKPNLEVGARYRRVGNATESALVGDLNPGFRKGYDTTDIFANWKPYGNDKMNVNFSVNNVFDKNYLPHAQRVGAGLPAAGRDFRVGVNFTY